MDPSNNPNITPDSKVNAAENVLSQEKGKDDEKFAVGLIVLFIILAILFSIPFAIYWIWAKTKWSRSAKIISTVVLSLIAVGISAYFVFAPAKKQANYTLTPPSQNTPSQTTASSSAQVSDWKSFSGGKVSFDYPAADYVKQVQTDQYYLLPDINSTNDQLIVDIDARALNTDNSYQEMVDGMKKQIIELTENKLDNGVKLTGKLTTKGKQFPYEIVILKGKTGFITLSTQDTKLDRFQQKMAVLEAMLLKLKY